MNQEERESMEAAKEATWELGIKVIKNYTI